MLADWLAQAAPAWLSRRLAPSQRRALVAITRCRTPALGGRVYRCSHCGEHDYAYHSCHHRACPRCGGGRTAAWTQRQIGRLLPVPYFLVTCTVPEAMRPLFVLRPEVMYDLLFSEAARSLQQVATQPRHLGAELGMVGVLHTWGRQLQLHPHVHFIVPGGGLRADHRKWRKSRRPDWFLPVLAVSAAFRQRFQEALQASAPDLYAQVSEATWRAEWVVHCQPAGSGEPVVRYLARYVSRTAISDERIIEATDDHVTFRYRDSKDGQTRHCTLNADEFMRRYLQHVFPPGLHRVRYFGWLHPAAKARRAVVDTLLDVVIVVRAMEEPPPAWHLHCPHCDQFSLLFVRTLARAPP